MRSLCALVYLFLVWTDGAAGVSDWGPMPFMEFLDPSHLVSLNWGFDHPQANVTFKLVVNTTGWVGFGFSPSGNMPGSDMVIGGFGPNGSYFTDRHAIGNFMPLVDEQQSYTLLNMSEINGQTIMTFRRPILLCGDQDFQITAGPVNLIYAYGLTDEIGYHQGRKGTKEVNLLHDLDVTIDSRNFSEHGSIGEMMKTPAVSCPNNNTNGLCNSWTMLFILWIAVM